jgi:ribosomal protein S27AE
MQVLFTVKGNEPECPKCGNWNAMLHYHGTATKPERLVCRDCKYEVPLPVDIQLREEHKA